VKTALVLSAIDPGLGGVLVTGPKGSGKTTIVRAMEEMLQRPSTSWAASSTATPAM